MASEVTIRSWGFGNDVTELRADAANLHVSNHSYGFSTGWSIDDDSDARGGPYVTSSGKVDVWHQDYNTSPTEDIDFGRYSSSTAEIDDIIYDNPHLLSVWSAGNDRNDEFENASNDNTYVAHFSSDPGGIGWIGSGWYLVGNGGNTTAPPADGNAGNGYDSLSITKTAKNTLVVGNVVDVTADPYPLNDIVTSSSSSYGGTDDGRIKPDVVGNGVGLYSPEDGSDSDYGTKSGTSMATPNVSGSAVLLIEHYENEFGQAPLAATTKGLLIHTAADAGNVGPDYAYGWGLVDVAKAADLVTDAVQLDADRSIRELTYEDNVINQTLSVDGSESLKVTMVWTDLPGEPVSPRNLDDDTAMLVNDLDLLLIGPDGSHYPWTLDVTSPATPAVRNSSNHVDNVEQVLIDAPVAGDYTIQIDSTDSVPFQNFSIIVEGGTLEGNEFVVTVTSDELDGNYAPDDLSLREAIELANRHASADTIVFDPAVFNAPQTIDLGSELDIRERTTIEGPGSNRLRLDGNGTTRVMHVNSGSGAVSMSGMNIHDGLTGLVNDGDLRLDEFHFDGNETTTDGGAISNGGNLWISNSLFTNNVAGNQGAAINNRPTATLAIHNSTFSGNSADNAAISNIGGVLDIHHSTIAANIATGTSGNKTAGVSNNGSGTINISNTIVADNLRDGAPRDFRSTGVVNSFGYNLVGTGGSEFNAPGDLTGTFDEPLDARLGDLSPNGGPTMTHALLSGSPALNAGAAEGDSLVNEFRFSEAAGSANVLDNASAASGSVSVAMLGVPGPRGYSDRAAAFDGEDDYVEISDPLTIGGSSHTMEAWIKVPAGAERGIILGNFFSTTTGNDQANWEVTADGEVRVYWKEGGQGAIDVRGTSDLRDDAWHHIAVVRDTVADEFRIYVDGYQESVTGSNSAGDSLDFAGGQAHRIGLDLRPSSSHVAFEGAIDQVALHDRALTSAEILGRATLFDQRGTTYPRNLGGRDIGAVESLGHLVVGATADLSDGHFGEDDLSLREAIRLGNDFVGHTDIGFNTDGAFGGPAEIDLLQGVFSINDSTTIAGPGANLLTIDGQQVTRLMHISGAGDVAIRGLTLSGGVYLGDGGAVQIDDGDVLLSQIVMTNNSAVDDGGALSTNASANVTIVDSTFSNNIANDVSGSETNVGGAIINRGDLTIRNSTLHNNFAESGGAIWTNGSLVLENSTLSNNAATANGGAIRSSSADGNTIISSTITENTVSNGGTGAAISNSNSQVTLHNTIVAGNTVAGAAENLAGPDFSGDYNLVGSSASGSVSGSGNVVTDQPLLGPLADNGGPTLTHRPLDGSPAINAGRPEDNSARTHWFRLNESADSTTIVDAEGSITGAVDGSGIALGADGPRGNAATFSSGGIQLDGPLNTDAFSDLTIEAWVKVPTDAEGRVGSILGNFRSSMTTSHQANFEIQADGKLRVYMQVGSSQVGIDLLDMTAQTDLRDGKWHHVALVREDDFFPFVDNRLFVDGIEEAATLSSSGILSFSDSQNLHWIGSDNRIGGLPFQGEIAEVAMHGRPMSSTELARRARAFDQRGDSYDRVINTRLDIGSVEVQLPDGDFDDNGTFDCDDINALTSEIAAGTHNLAFDLTSDGTVTSSDLTEWLAAAGAANLPSGNPYLAGDANLDGFVDVSDLNIWNSNKFQSVSLWCSGDFNADGVVDVSDLNIWSANKFQSSDLASHTPGFGSVPMDRMNPMAAISDLNSQTTAVGSKQRLQTVGRASYQETPAPTATSGLKTVSSAPFPATFQSDDDDIDAKRDTWLQAVDLAFLDLLAEKPAE